MKECSDPNCFSNDFDSLYMCDSCLEELLMNGMTMDDVYELYTTTKDMLEDGGTFEIFVKLASAAEGKDMTDDIMRKELSGFRENLFDIFNDIMQTKIAKDIE